MTDPTEVSEYGDSRQSIRHNYNVLDIYPLSNYYFGCGEAVSWKNETVADRVLRMKANYDAYGMRKCVEAVILVISYAYPDIPCLLLDNDFVRSTFQDRSIHNSILKLPGGRLQQDESDVDCLKRKLSSKLSVSEVGRGPEWEVGECLGIWWRPDFETLLYPFLPPHTKSPKECTKLFLVKLPASWRFTVPRNSRLLAVPLCQIHSNAKTYGAVISGVAQLLSKFSFNIVKS